MLQLHASLGLKFNLNLVDQSSVTLQSDVDTVVKLLITTNSVQRNLFTCMVFVTKISAGWSK